MHLEKFRTLQNVILKIDIKYIVLHSLFHVCYKLTLNTNGRNIEFKIVLLVK